MRLSTMLFPLLVSLLCQAAVPMLSSSGDTSPSAIWKYPLPMTGDPVPGFEPLDQIAVGLMQKYRVPGMALGITKGGRLILARGYGYADVDTRTRVYPDSLFRLASVSKPLTATAADLLVEQGKLSYNTKVFDVLHSLSPPGGQHEDPGVNDITVEELMNHRSGFPHHGDIFSAAKLLGLPLPGSFEGVIRYQLGRPLDYAPGTKKAYSNLGYGILAQVVQTVAQIDYEKYVTHEVLTRIGLSHTKVGSHLKQNNLTGEVTYYVPAGTPPVSPVYANMTGPVPFPYGGIIMDWPGSTPGEAAGAWISNTMDMLRITASVTLGRAPEMFAKPPRTGFAFSAFPIGRGWEWRHDGGMPGTATTLHILDDVAWCILTNGKLQHTSIGSFINDFDVAVKSHVIATTKWPTGNLFEHY